MIKKYHLTCKKNKKTSTIFFYGSFNKCQLLQLVEQKTDCKCGRGYFVKEDKFFYEGNKVSSDKATSHRTRSGELGDGTVDLKRPSLLYS